MKYMKFLTVFSVMTLLTCLGIQAQKKWVGTWATAIERPLNKDDMPKTSLTNHALRQIIHVSLGGKKIRLQLSNEMSTQPLEIKSVYIADAGTGKAIDTNKAKYLTFNGKQSITIEAGKAVYTDVLKFTLKPLQLLSITINYGQTPAQATTHRGSRTTSYIMEGESTPEIDFQTKEKVEHWYNIAALEVEGSKKTRCIACLGNSITDGRGTTTDKQNRWTDVLAEKFKGKVGVLNLGIGGNCVVKGGLSLPAIKRFDRDILGQQGVTDLIIFEGINDIGGIKDDGKERTRQVIQAYKHFIEEAHAKGIKVYGGTITQIKNTGYWSDFQEKARKNINQWIRTAGNFDGLIDFEKAVASPQDADAMRDDLKFDDLHPNAEGYRLLGECAAEAVK